MIEVTSYQVTFKNGLSNITKGFKCDPVVFLKDEIDLTIFRYEIAIFFQVPVVDVKITSRINILGLWVGGLEKPCKYMKFKIKRNDNI